MHIDNSVFYVYLDHTISSAKSHLLVKYKDGVLWDRNYDMCKQALKLDTPYSCPIKAGKFQ